MSRQGALASHTAVILEKFELSKLFRVDILIATICFKQLLNELLTHYNELIVFPRYGIIGLFCLLAFCGIRLSQSLVLVHETLGHSTDHWGVEVELFGFL